jgi:CMP-N,N'-diacetyllegionaminic acid synthase
MYKNKRILAVIPARGGSKGLSGKNIRLFAGKPLIVWTIKQALASRYLDEIIVSTDDSKIAKIANKYGAKTPFLRPKKLATSSAKIAEVLIHALDFLERKGQGFDLIMLLQPTSPLRKTEDIDKAIKIFFQKNAQSVVSVCFADHHPFWCNTLPKNDGMKNFYKQVAINKNRQELPEYYCINGAVYLISVVLLRKEKKFITERTYAYKMPRERSVDIDTVLDFDFAQFLKIGENAQKCQKI